MNPEINNRNAQPSEANPLPNNQAGSAVSTPVVDSMIPYKNKNALIGYYLGVASVIPFLGAIFFIPAYAFSIFGLIAVNKTPSIKGKVHAIVGIALASLQLVGLIGFAVFVVIADNANPY
jgi:hypothetical protein